MIKRYGLGANPEALTANSMRPGLMQMVERKDGDYVLYDDHAAILESIGAGGVSGRITSKSIDEHKAEFDAWYGSYDVRTPQHPFERHVAWLAWMEARGLRVNDLKKQFITTLKSIES